MLHATDPIQKIHHIGEKTESKLRRLGIKNVGDLIWHLPIRYQDLSRVTPVAQAQSTLCTIRGKVTHIRSWRSFRKRMTITELSISDGTGIAKAVWFNQPYLKDQIHADDELFLAGTPELTLTGPSFTNPIYEKTRSEQLHTARIIPFYRLTQGITHKQLRFLIHEAFSSLADVPDDLPQEIRKAEKLPPLPEALQTVHLPDSEPALERAQRRLKLEELFWLQLAVAYARQERSEKKGVKLTFKEAAVREFVRTLPFVLTAHQKKAAWDILKDLEHDRPMNRLVQGDVGSGKTVVATLAILNTALNGAQSILMAPTELLALQHFKTVTSLLPRHRVALLTAHQRQLNGEKQSRVAIVEAFAAGKTEVLIGTQSLIQPDIAAGNAALVVIDEQHRFGVAQRKQATLLNRDGTAPHLLSLTATPIPRTLALTLYGDLDISVIRGLPANRKPILTKIVPENKRSDAYAFMRKKIQSGQQVFILCPLIDDEDQTERKSVLREYERLRDTIFPDLTVKFVHGKLRSDEKKGIMEAFRENQFPILVATSVIEVGIDIPNATIMVIEGAERFGLAQLHQFRGRVGRNELQSYCFLFTSANSGRAPERLELLTKHTDGFKLAEADLRMRGEGNIFGTEQSGILNLAIASLHDQDLIQTARHWVDRIVAHDTDRSFYRRVRHKMELLDDTHPE